MKSWEDVTEKANTYSTMAKAEYVAIIDILTDAKYREKPHMSVSQLRKAIDAQFNYTISDKRLRNAIVYLLDYGIINETYKTKKGKEVAHYSLESGFKDYKIIPTNLLNLVTITTLFSLAIFIYQIFVGDISFMLDVAYLVLGYNILIFIANYIDFNYNISNYREYLTKIRTSLPIDIAKKEIPRESFVDSDSEIKNK